MKKNGAVNKDVLIVKGFWLHFRNMWINFYHHNGVILSAATSFYAIMSGVSMIMLGFSIAGLIVGSPQKAASLLLNFMNLQGLFPDGAIGINSLAQTLVSRAETATFLSLILFIIFSGTVFLSIESALNRIFDVEKGRHILRKVFVAYLTMFITYLSFFGSAFVTWGAMIITDYGITVLGVSPTGLNTFWELFILLVPFMLISFFFGILYKVVPWCSVPWKYALLSGLFAGIMWEIAKRVFTFYVRYIVRYDELYGGISTLLATFLWVFYTFVIMFLGGSLAKSMMRLRNKDLLITQKV